MSKSVRRTNVCLTRVHVLLAVAFGAEIAVAFFVVDALTIGLNTRRELSFLFLGAPLVLRIPPIIHGFLSFGFAVDGPEDMRLRRIYALKKAGATHFGLGR